MSKPERVSEEAPEIKVVRKNGNFHLLSKSKKNRRTMIGFEVHGYGCLILVSTKQDGQLAESLCWLPGVKIETDNKKQSVLIKI